MGNDKKLIFRRVNGRVIPIHAGPRNKQDIKMGAVVTTAGVATAAGGGYATRKLIEAAEAAARRTEYYADRFTKIMRSKRFKSKLPPAGQLAFSDLGAAGFDKLSAKEARRLAYKNARLGRRFSKASSIARLVSPAIGGYMVTKGVQMIGESAEKKDKKLGQAFKTTAPLVGALTAIGTFGASSGLLKKSEFARGVFRAVRTKVF
jgi:hypothetical protein